VCGGAQEGGGAQEEDGAQGVEEADDAAQGPAPPPRRGRRHAETWPERSAVVLIKTMGWCPPSF